MKIRNSVRIYSGNTTRKNHLKTLRKKVLNYQDYVEYYFIQKSDETLYIECRKYTKDYLEFSDLDYKVKGLIEFDLINKKLTKSVNFNSYWSDAKLLTYLGVEFLLDDSINNRTYNTTIYDFIKSIFKIYTKPSDILKSIIVSEGFTLNNFPMSDFKRVIGYDKNVWQNKVSHYMSIFFYMKNVVDLTMFFKHISKLKKMALVDMFQDANTLGYKVNMRWSYNRIKLEHENWSYEIRDKRLLSEENEQLSTGYTYPKIEGAELLTSKFALVYEGQEMKHCVGGSGYWESCKRGTSAIYSYKNKQSKHLRATIEIKIDTNNGTVTLNQIQRKGNRLYIPDEIKESIRKQLKGYVIPELREKK